MIYLHCKTLQGQWEDYSCRIMLVNENPRQSQYKESLYILKNDEFTYDCSWQLDVDVRSSPHQV